MGSSPFDQSPSFGAASHQFRLPSVSELHPGFVPPAPCHGEMQQLFLTSGRPPPFHWPVPANDSSGPRSASSSSMSFRDNYITDYSNDASQDIAGSNSAYQLSGGSLSVSENDRLLGDMQYGNCYCPFPPANGRQPSQDFLGSFTAPESLYSTNAFAPTSTEEYPCPLDSSFARPSHLISNDQTPISNNSPYQPLPASPSAISIEETLAALDMLRNGGTSGKSSFSGDAAAAAAAAIPTTTAGPILHPQRNHPRTDASWGSIAVPVSLPIRKSVSRRYEPAHSAVSPGQYRRGSATPSVSAAAAAARFGGLGGHGHGETHVLPFRRNSSLFLSRDGSGVMGTEGKARKSMSRGPTEDDYPMFFGLACSGRSSLGSLFRESDTAAAAAAGVGGDHGGGGGEGGERRGSKRARCGE